MWISVCEIYSHKHFFSFCSLIFLQNFSCKKKIKCRFIVLQSVNSPAGWDYLLTFFLAKLLRLVSTQWVCLQPEEHLEQLLIWSSRCKQESFRIKAVVATPSPHCHVTKAVFTGCFCAPWRSCALRSVHIGTGAGRRTARVKVGCRAYIIGEDGQFATLQHVFQLLVGGGSSSCREREAESELTWRPFNLYDIEKSQMKWSNWQTKVKSTLSLRRVCTRLYVLVRTLITEHQSGTFVDEDISFILRLKLRFERIISMNSLDLLCCGLICGLMAGTEHQHLQVKNLHCPLVAAVGTDRPHSWWELLPDI